MATIKESSRKTLYILGVFICLAVVAASISVPLTIWLMSETSEVPEPKNDDTAAVIQEGTDIKWPAAPDDSQHQYRFASVACAEGNCSRIGAEVLAEGGTAVDAMIATSLCLGVARTTSNGIGGGGFMTYYNRSSGETVVLDYRETAPKMATSTMYEEGSNITSKIGGGSIGVPGEVAGLWLAHQRFGRLPWSRLFEPSIKLAENGITLNEYVAGLLKQHFHKFNDALKGIFMDPVTKEVKKAGDTVVFAKQAASYRKLAKEGMDTFYTGSLKDDIIADLEELDGQIVTAEDLRDYKVEVKTPIRSTLRNGEYTIVSPPLPSGGIVVQHLLQILNGYNFTAASVSPKLEDVKSTATTYHRIVEAMKFAYAKRMNLGDPAFANITEHIKNMMDPEFAEEVRAKITDNTTHDIKYYGVTTDARLTTGTSQISILAGNGDAVSTTTTINYGFGSKRMGKRTGIIFNNEMDDFSRPGIPSWTDDAWVAPTNKANWIEPGKKPLSSMSPSVITNKEGDVVLVTGGSGGSKIITAVTLTIMNNLWLGMNVTEAVARPRLHHQLLPETILHEAGFPQVYLDELKKKGHKLTFNPKPPVSDSVGQHEGVVTGAGDSRRLGAADGF